MGDVESVKQNQVPLSFPQPPSTGTRNMMGTMGVIKMIGGIIINGIVCSLTGNFNGFLVRNTRLMLMT